MASCFKVGSKDRFMEIKKIIEKTADRWYQLKPDWRHSIILDATIRSFFRERREGKFLDTPILCLILKDERCKFFKKQSKQVKTVSLYPTVDTEVGLISVLSDDHDVANDEEAINEYLETGKTDNLLSYWHILILLVNNYLKQYNPYAFPYFTKDTCRKLIVAWVAYRIDVIALENASNSVHPIPGVPLLNYCLEHNVEGLSDTINAAHVKCMKRLIESFVKFCCKDPDSPPDKPKGTKSIKSIILWFLSSSKNSQKIDPTSDLINDLNDCLYEYMKKLFLTKKSGLGYLYSVGWRKPDLFIEFKDIKIYNLKRIRRSPIEINVDDICSQISSLVLNRSMISTFNKKPRNIIEKKVNMSFVQKRAFRSVDKSIFRLTLSRFNQNTHLKSLIPKYFEVLQSAPNPVQLLLKSMNEVGSSLCYNRDRCLFTIERNQTIRSLITLLPKLKLILVELKPNCFELKKLNGLVYYTSNKSTSKYFDSLLDLKTMVVNKSIKNGFPSVHALLLGKDFKACMKKENSILRLECITKMKLLKNRYREYIEMVVFSAYFATTILEMLIIVSYRSQAYYEKRKI